MTCTRVPLDVRVASLACEQSAGWAWVAADGEFACGSVQANPHDAALLGLIALGEAVAGQPTDLPLRVTAPQVVLSGLEADDRGRLASRVGDMIAGRAGEVTLLPAGPAEGDAAGVPELLAGAVGLCAPGTYEWGLDPRAGLRALRDPGRVLASRLAS